MTLRDHLGNALPFAEADLAPVLATAPRRYKVFQIPKRTPGSFRVIAQPAPEVKLVQRVLVRDFISNWPVHSAATAYRVHTSIRDHAQSHVRSRFLLKLDFSDFFLSISREDISQHAKDIGGMSEEDAKLLSWLVSWKNKATGRLSLSIGAPSSPAVSNSIMFPFDEAISKTCGRFGVTYTRYADDLAFSTSNADVLNEIEKIVIGQLESLPYPRLRLNQKKTINVSTRDRRSLVGLVLTPENRVSLGRAKKREIRAMTHHFVVGRLAVDKVGTLRGLLSFAWSVEPTFVRVLVDRYGNEVFERLALPFRGHARGTQDQRD
jgi:RNA-directed DNA polymerase